MGKKIILASGSETRQKLLKNAGVDFTVETARIDEDTIRKSLLQENATPRDIADTLAEFKARKVAQRNPESFVIGCDQVLVYKGKIYSKSQSISEAESLLSQMRNQKHQLLSAVVIYKDAQPDWRHVGVSRLTMRNLSDPFINDYLRRNWESVRYSVGCYNLEAEGVRLFAQIDGNFFDILGLPLIPVLSYLAGQGAIAA